MPFSLSTISKKAKGMIGKLEEYWYKYYLNRSINNFYLNTQIIPSKTYKDENKYLNIICINII